MSALLSATREPPIPSFRSREPTPEAARPAMSHSYVIEVGDADAGIVTRESVASAYQFFASDPRFLPLEGKMFRAPRQAEKLARDLIARRSPVALGSRVAS